MIRKSEYYQKIDMYLNNELTGEELREFNVELLLNSGLAEEVQFQREVQQAAQEVDIMDLRNNLKEIMEQETAIENFQEAILSENINYNFGLSDELSSFREFYKPVEINDFNNLSHSLPRIHLFQHNIAAKENIHQFYKEQKLDADSEEDLLSPADETIFAEIQNALQEKDVFELRSNLQQIAQNMPEHERSTEEIEKYIDQELSTEQLENMKYELQFNSQLSKDIELHLGINQAIAETDIMLLRSKLEQIQESEHSTSRRTEEIDKYIYDELDEMELVSFENELVSNPDLTAEVEMFKEIDIAVREKDVIDLRSHLQDIGKNIAGEKKQRSIKLPSIRYTIASIAASLVLILSVAGILSRQSVPEHELYSSYYEPYQTSGIMRSGNTTMDNTLTAALQKLNAQEYESALALFQQVVAYDEKNPVGHFYSGVSYQEIGRFTKAIDEYNLVIKDKDNLFIEQAEWYIGLCYLQTRERKKAYKQLERIAKSDSYYNKKAAAIIRRLKFIE